MHACACCLHVQSKLWSSIYDFLPLMFQYLDLGKCLSCRSSNVWSLKSIYLVVYISPSGLKQYSLDTLHCTSPVHQKTLSSCIDLHDQCFRSLLDLPLCPIKLAFFLYWYPMQDMAYCGAYNGFWFAPGPK